MKKIFFLLFSAFITFNTHAQLVVNTGAMTPTQYVQNVLVGSGVTVSNVTFSGDANQIGEFNATGTNPFLGLTDGLVMATGNANVAVGPNNTGSDSQGGGNFGNGDSDLDILEGGVAGTNDAAILEFDFIPTGDTIKFNFVFASEEYPEYAPPNGGINDVFGFFLSGPGINGSFSNNAENIALIPGTAQAVSINNINAVTNAAYYVDNTGNFSNQSIQFDGYTVIMTAVSAVQCGQMYHIKLAIADASDTSWDSGVFLEGGSFNSEVVQVDVVTATGDSTIIEDCGNAVFSFSRPSNTGDYTVHYDIGGNAINGTDYNFITDSLVIPDGQYTADLTIVPIGDAIAEGQDTLTLTVYTVNPCGDTIVSTGVLYILDVPNLIVNAPDTSLCPTPSNITLNVSAYGAVPPFTYEWTNTQGAVLGNGTSISVSGNQTDTFYVSVTDSCNLVTVIDTVHVAVNDDLAAITTSGDTTLYCAGQVIFLEAFPVDGISLYDYSWSNGSNSSITSVNPAATISYYVTATNQCNGSADTDTINVIVDYTPMEIISTTNDTILECLGSNYSLDLYAVVQNGTLPYSFAWDDGAAGSSDSLFQTIVNAPTNFYLTITDACGLFTQDTVEVDFEPFNPMTVDPSGIDTVCSGSQVELSARPSGGVSPYSYLWETGETTGVILFGANGSTDTEVAVTVTDKCGQQVTETVLIPIKVCEVIPMNVMTPNGDGMNEFLVFQFLENFPNNHLIVYNRWGMVVFEEDNYQNDWDGDNLSDGTYFYILSLNDLNNTVHKGTFTLFH